MIIQRAQTEKKLGVQSKTQGLNSFKTKQNEIKANKQTTFQQSSKERLK